MSQASSVHRVAPGRCVRLSGVEWRTYSRLLHTFGDRRDVRLTYDRGELEIMSPRLEHDDDSDFLGVLIRTLTDELDLPVKGGGSVTMRRRKKERGLEADRCYWIANAARMTGRRELDLRTDPPPDLAVETDVTHGSLARLPIYAALGVPELWRLKKNRLTFHALDANGKYAEVSTSRSFPLITPADLMVFVQLARQGGDQNTIVRQFREWIRQHRQEVDSRG